MFKKDFKTKGKDRWSRAYPAWDDKEIAMKEDLDEANQRIDLLCKHLDLHTGPDTECETKLLTVKEYKKKHQHDVFVW